MVGISKESVQYYPPNSPRQLQALQGIHKPTAKPQQPKIDINMKEREKRRDSRALLAPCCLLLLLRFMLASFFS